MVVKTNLIVVLFAFVLLLVFYSYLSVLNIAAVTLLTTMLAFRHLCLIFLLTSSRAYFCYINLSVCSLMTFGFTFDITFEKGFLIP